MLPLFIPAVFITLMFFLSGFEKIGKFTYSSVKFTKRSGLPLILAKVIIAAVILLEIIAPTIIAAYTFTGLPTLVPFFKLAVIGLISFTVLATAIYHNPLKTKYKESFYTFMSNISTIGGLLALYVSVA